MHAVAGDRGLHGLLVGGREHVSGSVRVGLLGQGRRGVEDELDPHPAVLGLVLNVRDVTETAHAEEELARQRDSLHQSEKLSALGGLLAGVAHELNNPLAVVVGRASQLETDAESMADRNTAAKIRQAAERCARIVKTFLAMARRQESVREPVDLNQVINDALDVLTYTLRSGGVTSPFSS